MSRFSNLEFGRQQESADRQQSQAVLKDEAFYLAEAQSAFERADFESALRAYAKVLEYNPENAGAWTGQVRMLLELNEFHEAKIWADKALERFPNEPELLAAKAVALGRIGDLKGALAFSDASIEERGNTPYIWLARGDVLMAREENRAEYCFEKAHELEPGNWLIHWLGSRIFAYYKKFSLALKMIQTALELDAGRSVIWLQQGYCQQALGLTAQAQNSFEQVRQLGGHRHSAEEALLSLAQQRPWQRFSNWWKSIFRS